MADSEEMDLYDEWFEFTGRFVGKLNESEQDWTKLTESEQELAALWKLEMDMHNGGFIQFFCNWGFDCYTYAIRSLTKLQAHECVAILTNQHTIIQRLENENRLQTLWDIPRLLTIPETESINKSDQQYWNNSDNIIEKTFKIYSF